MVVSVCILHTNCYFKLARNLTLIFYNKLLLDIAYIYVLYYDFISNILCAWKIVTWRVRQSFNELAPKKFIDVIGEWVYINHPRLMYIFISDRGY